MAVVFFVDGIKWAKYIPIGLFCKDVPFEVSATKIYLDDIAKEMPEFFSDKAAMISLICNISPSEDLMINMAYGLAYGIPASGDAHDAVNVFYDHYCRFIDRIVLEYADKNVKNDKDILGNVLELYCDRRKYIYPYYKDVYELPGLCYAVPHELLMDEEIFSKILYIADPGEVYNELLTDEEKLDKGIVCRLLKELKYSDFSYFKEGFCNLCDNVSRDILMDKEVRELFFRSGIPSLIYEEILTEKGFLIFCRSG
ncbi:MAG: hypothetical protein IKO53_04465 [Lachnospiraceae bacterium]|nr:hypothetical protein [Lachnospiraceae bacterium]